MRFFYHLYLYFQIKCICHSLALVVKHAFEKWIPDSVAFLLHEVPAHFSRSTLRRKEFEEIQEVMGCGDEKTPFQRYVETRWLARGQVMRCIYTNWDTLLAYFTSISKQVPQEQRYKIAKLCEVFNDRSIYCLLAFLLPIIEQFEKLNKMFQVKSSII